MDLIANEEGITAVRTVGTLTDFLRRHPFASQQVLESAFGERGLQILMSGGGRRIRRVDLPGLGPCFAEEREPDATLIGSHRREVARGFAAHVFGARPLAGGISPGVDADLEFPSNGDMGGIWWRVWVDLGGCAPEALGFVADPPTHFDYGVRDIVLTTDIDRLKLIAHQIESRWRGEHPIHLISSESLAHRTVLPEAIRGERAWLPPDEGRIEALVRARQRGSHHRSRLAKVVPHLSDEDWSLLARVGDHPLLTPTELSYVKSGSVGTLKKELLRLAMLERLCLIETPKGLGPRVFIERRKILSWRGLELLAGRWGSSPQIMSRFHPWPQHVDHEGRVLYSTGWLRAQYQHQPLVRQFGLAMIDGARRVSNARGGVRVELETTIAARISYKENHPEAGRVVSWVAPDARARVEFWQGEREDGGRSTPQRLGRYSLWIEVDRATIPVNRLSDRIDRYVSALNAMRGRNPALIWVIDGSPYRERQILDLMKAQGIDGWAVTLQRLVLPKDDRWWLLHPHAGVSRVPQVGLPYEAIGGMSPWRTVWRSCTDTHLRPLLGVEPWTC